MHCYAGCIHRLMWVLDGAQERASVGQFAPSGAISCSSTWISPPPCGIKGDRLDEDEEQIQPLLIDLTFIWGGDDSGE